MALNQVSQQILIFINNNYQKNMYYINIYGNAEFIDLVEINTLIDLCYDTTKTE